MVAVVATTATTVAGRGEPPPSATLEAARARLATELEHAAHGPLDHLRWRPEPAIAPMLCERMDGRPTDHERTTSLGLEAALPPGQDGVETAASLAAAWRARGLVEVRRRRSSPAVLVLTGEREGMVLELVVNRRSRRAFVGGSTPCLPSQARRGAG